MFPRLYTRATCATRRASILSRCNQQPRGSDLENQDRSTNTTTLATTDNQAAPTSGYASLRIFNAGVAAGALDVYVVATDADLSTAVASASLSPATTGAYIDFPKGTYHLRVTAAGNRADVRLDVPAITLADQQVASLVLTAASTGALVDGLLVNQGGSTTAWRNADARLRVVAAVTGNGTVAATTSDGALSTALQSPSVGSYAVVPVALPGLVVKVNGIAIDTSTLAIAAGADATLLVYGDAAAPQWRLLIDDNLPSTVTTNTKLRVVHVLNGLGSTLSLSADYVGVANNVAFGTASAPADVAAGTSMRLEVDSPVRTTPLYLATDVSLTAQNVYSLFAMGDAAAPVTVLRKDR